MFLRDMADNVYRLEWCSLGWSEWISLQSSLSAYQTAIPAAAGVYRVRARGKPGLVYVGQTGRSLRERTRALAKHALGESPPWNDPHTAAPALWAWRVDEGLEYELSVARVELPTPDRQCLEDLLLLEHRLEIGESTLCNHGRFHPNWRRPSNRAKGRRMQRLPDGSQNPASGSSIPPVHLSGQPIDSNWLGLNWSEAVRLSGADVPNRSGIYRLMDASELVYLGESRQLRVRLRSHASRLAGASFRVSYCELPGALPHQLKEREADIIGAYYKQTRTPPRLQYGGGRA